MEVRRIERFLKFVATRQWLHKEEIQTWDTRRAFYENPQTYRFIEEEPSSTATNDISLAPGVTLFLDTIVSIPPQWLEYPTVVLIFEAGGEGLLSIDGKPYHGLDNNHQHVSLPRTWLDTGSLSLSIELFHPPLRANDLLNRPDAVSSSAPLSLRQCSLAVPNLPVQSLLCTAQVITDTIKLLPDENLQKARLTRSLSQVVDAAYSASAEQWRDAEWVETLEQQLRRDLEETPKIKEGLMHMIGQSHIDVAWLWPLKETIRKCSRTFSTACQLLDEYPEFLFTQSQPQLYAYTKQYYPDLYERIKQHIAAGRWEVIGGMWVEPDLNIPSGESLVRQLVYGLKFFQDEFGVTPRVEWLPDTFGYCASLPQLLKKAGIEYFMTTKLNWNDTNHFPSDLFHWVGIDGTSILSFLNHGLNEDTRPRDVHEHWKSFRQKQVHPEQMLLYGHGDGGGGVTREMIEYVERSGRLPGLPDCVPGKAHDFFDGIQEAHPDLPTWYGDMYLELHRGTYTSQARNKRFNRKAESLYREAEIWSSLMAARGASYPSAQLEYGWKQLLMNQFHDIIPGSSIPEVYETSTKDYQEIFSIGEEVRRSALATLQQDIDTTGEGTPVILWNSLSWQRHDLATIRGGQELANTGVYDKTGHQLESDILKVGDGAYELYVHVPEIPQLGYTTLWLRPQSLQVPTSTTTYDGSWDTDFYHIEWNERGEITHLYDKQAQREIVKEGETANQFQLFHDLPLNWDAWDVDPRFEEQPAGNPQLTSAYVKLQGEKMDIIHFEWKLSASTIAQDMILYHRSPRIDFATEVDWQETHKLLKVAFPVDVFARKATYEIPFGSVERATHTNTSWEQAQFEVCGHRWADLSEGNYGVSLLNDCKYGYDIKKHVMRLSLLRAPKYPDPGADLGHQKFTYALYPHQDQWREAMVVHQGYELNQPVVAVWVEAHAGQLPSHYSFLHTESQHVIVDTIKQAEDGKDLVVRAYESGGGREGLAMRFALPIESAQETNLLEKDGNALALQGQTVQSTLQPYEVKTFKVQVKEE